MVRSILSILLGAFVLFEAGSVQAEERKKIMIGYVAPSALLLIPLLAREVGIFEKHGLDVDAVLMNGSSRLVQSLIAGDFDYVVAGAAPLLRARIDGADPVILAAATNYTSQRIMVRTNAGIRRLQELDGRIVGVSRYGSEGDTFLRTLLRRVGLQPDTDVTIVQSGAGLTTLQALAAGEIQAAAMGSAAAIAAKQIGAVELANGQDRQVFALMGAVATTRRKINRDRPEVVEFMRAYVEGIHFFKTNREASIRIMQKLMGRLPSKTISVLYDEAKDLYQRLPTPAHEAVQAVLDREADPKAGAFEVSDFVDLSFLGEIEQSRFLEQLYQ